MINIGSRIKAARQEKGMSQEELAQAIGVTKSTISKYEKGAREPKYDQLQRIAKILGVPIHELFDGSTVDEDGAIHIWPAQTEPRAQIPGGDMFDYLVARWRLAEKFTAPERDNRTVVDAGSSTLDLAAPQQHRTSAPELDALLAKLQDGEPLVLSPEELAKLKNTPKEQIAAVLDKAPTPQKHSGGGHAFYCRPLEHPELNALCLKFQDGTITPDEQERMNVLLAIATKLEGYEPLQNDFCDNLRNYRDAAGLSRNKLADKTGISATKIRDYEDSSKVAFVTDSDLYRLAHFFGVDPIKLKGRSVTQEWMTDTHSKNCLRRVNDAWRKLNALGHDKLAERAEELVEMSRYRAQEPPTGPSSAPEDTDTTVRYVGETKCPYCGYNVPYAASSRGGKKLYCPKCGAAFAC